MSINTRNTQNALGIIGLDHELVDRSQERKQAALDKSNQSRRNELESKRRYWRKNSAHLNAKRAAKRATIEGRYRSCKNRARARNQEWGFTLDTWVDIWVDADPIYLAGTESPQHPKGRTVTAYSRRGPDKEHNSYMRRIDLSKGWDPDNCEIIYRGRILYPSQGDD